MKCPYNPAHIVPVDSFVTHLSKCKATNKQDFAQCKFNQLHVVRKQVLEKHYLCTHIIIQNANKPRSMKVKMTVIGLAKSKVRRIGVKIGVYRWNSQNQNMPKTYQIPKLRIGDINILYKYIFICFLNII